ncbi:MAG: hypothetical protein WBE34_07040, partial [Candidatus Nitrosopolaris sp.]
VVIGLIGSFLPLTLYSSQNQLLQIIHNPAAFGIGVLLLMMLVKAVLTSMSFATGFNGGKEAKSARRNYDVFQVD